MPETAIVATVQPRWKRYDAAPALHEDLTRFMRLARDKRADVVLFPELAGLLVAGPLAVDRKGSLNKQSGLFGRLLGSMGGAPQLADALPMLVTRHGEELTERYASLFGGLAREYGMVVVGGSILVEGEDGITAYRSGVFASDGSLMGWQAKLHLTEAEAGSAQPGESLTVFEAPFGRFGVLIGNDILFPELARALAYRGCIGIFNPTLAHSDDGWRRQHFIAKARAQENQLFVAQSFLVGVGDLFPGEAAHYAGRSSILAPVELSPRGDGVLGMVGAEKVEGVVAGEWNVGALHNLWRTTEIPVRALMRGELFGELLAFDYQSGATISERTADVEEVARLHDVVEVPPIEPLPDDEPALSPLLGQVPPVEAAEPAEYVTEGIGLLDDGGDEPATEEEPESLQTATHAVTVLDAETGDEAAAEEEQDSLQTAMRSVPVIDPETGYYLGERVDGAEEPPPSDEEDTPQAENAEES